MTVGVISRGTVVRQRFEANPIAYQNCSIDATKVNHDLRIRTSVGALQFRKEGTVPKERDKR